MKTIYDSTIGFAEISGGDSLEDFNKDNDLNYEDEWEVVNDYVEMLWDDVSYALNQFDYSTYIGFADLGLWDGRRKGYAEYNDLIEAFTYGNYDGTIISVDRYGQLHATLLHHDGRNYVTYRELKHDLSDTQIDNFFELLQSGNITKKQITYYTKPLGKRLLKKLGWA